MNRFDYVRASSVADAVTHAGRGRASILAGGTNLVDLMKENVARPDRLVDIARLALRAIEPLPDGGLRLGALATNAEVAEHPEVERRYPLLARAILAGASPQLRNMATTGGNLLQRTRCYYFYDVGAPCNKREPGTGCPAVHGYNRIHAVLGASAHCVAVHPSDMCVALAALDARVQVAGPHGAREIPFREFHRLPGDAPERDTTLEPGELVTAVDLPPDDLAAHVCYLKLRDRASYAFALVSVGAALALDGDTIVDARVALGGVAHRPWRDPALEHALRGRRATADVFRPFADAMLTDAIGLAHNAFKIELARRAIVRALVEAAGGAP